MVGFIYEKRTSITPPSRGKKAQTPNKRSVASRSQTADNDKYDGYFISRKQTSPLARPPRVSSKNNLLTTSPASVLSSGCGGSLCVTIDSSSTKDTSKDSRVQADKDCSSGYRLNTTPSSYSLANLKSRQTAFKRVLSAKKRTSLWVTKTVNMHRQKNLSAPRFSKPLLKFSSNHELLWEDIGRLNKFPRPKTPRPEDLGGSRYREHTIWRTASSKLDSLYKESDELIGIASSSSSHPSTTPESELEKIPLETKKSAPSLRPKPKLVRIPVHNVNNQRNYSSKVNGSCIPCGHRNPRSSASNRRNPSPSNRPVRFYILPSGVAYREM